MKVLGVAAGFLGVVVMIGLPAFGGGDNLFAQIAVVTATVSYAFAGVYGRRFKAMEISPIITAAGATNLLLVTLLVPVSAILLGSVFLKESLETVHFLGMALIALGLSAIDGRLWRRGVPEKN